MIVLLKKILIDIHTTKDNVTFCSARVWFSATMLAYQLFTFIEVLFKHALDYQNYGIGLSTIVASFGAYTFLKQGTEPDGHN